MVIVFRNKKNHDLKIELDGRTKIEIKKHLLYICVSETIEWEAEGEGE